MKFLFAIILVIASASARGSGPYLPSGWRPKGPAFLLPSEVAFSAAKPIQELQFTETEASGSDALREYGPPKLEEVTLSVTQALPELITERAFFVAKSEAVVGLVGDPEKNIVEVNEERVAVIADDVSRPNGSQVTESVRTGKELTTETSDLKPSVKAQPLTELKQKEETECEEVTDHEDIVASTPGGTDEVTPTAAVERQSLDLLQNINEIAEAKTTEEVKESKAVLAVSAAINTVVPTDAIAVHEVNNGEQVQSVFEVIESDDVKELKTTDEKQKETIVNAILSSDNVVTPRTTIDTQAVGELQDTSDIVQSEDIKDDIIKTTTVEENDVTSTVIEGQTVEVLDQVKETTEIIQSEDIKEHNINIAPTATIIEESRITSTVPEDQIIKVLEEIKDSVEVIQSEEVKELGNKVVTTAATEEYTITPTTSNALETVEETSEAIKIEEIKKQEEFIVIVEDNVFPTAAIEEVVVPLSQQDLLQNDVSYTTSEVVVGVTERINNILEAIINTEEENKTENKAEVRTTPEKQELNAPGFAVYGPPQQEDLARIAEVSSPGALEINEVRRRRFSPKLRLTRKH